ncbi:GNAT family N-acetyltransferase [Streptomyces sp. NPDC049881]|uniref:GNAT family N-acetyltransferase n=1 Tax=Streptomyces sp. NPDC049881 TaxID=3155778 RepID=UPI00341A5962
MSTMFRRRLTRWQAETERASLAEVYAAAHPGGPGAADREAFLRRLVDHDLGQPEFDMVLAGDPRPAGCVWGFRVDEDAAWWSAFAEPPVAPEVFVVAGLLVAPRSRRQGVATGLLRQLLSRTRAPLALAPVAADDGLAQASYGAWGWTRGGPLTPVDGGAPLTTWTLAAPARAV